MTMFVVDFMVKQMSWTVVTCNGETSGAQAN